MTPSAKKVLAWELLEHGTPLFLGRHHRRRLGDVCVVMPGGSRVCGADATSIAGSVAQPAEGRAAMGGQATFTTQSGGLSPTVSAVLSQAQYIYNSNPALLSQNQWALLQSAGIIPNTLSWTSASQLPNAQVAAIAALPTAAGADIMLGNFDLTAFVASVPWWGWALGAGGLVFLFAGKQKKGRR
jgi:hypothetical protein